MTDEGRQIAILELLLKVQKLETDREEAWGPFAKGIDSELRGVYRQLAKLEPTEEDLRGVTTVEAVEIWSRRRK